MAIFKKKKTSIEIIEEWTPILKEFAEKHNADVVAIDVDKYSSVYDDKKRIDVSFKIRN